jgi:hypothetical protein
MSLTKTTILTAAATIAALAMTGGAFAKTFEAVYTVSIHAKATKKSSIVDKLFEGEHVKINSCDDDWCLIIHDGPDGWVPLASLETVGGGYSGDEGPTIVIQGGFDFGHGPKKPGGGIIVDPVHPKPPKHLGPIVGTFPTTVSNPGFGPKPVLPPKHPVHPFPVNGGTLGTGGNNICAIKPIACQGGFGGKPHL